MDKVKENVVLKNLLHECINGDEHGFKPDLTKSEWEAVEWAIEQAEKVERYEKALKEIAEFGGTDMLGKTCAKVAKEALQEEGRIILGNLEHIGKIPKKPRI